MKKTELSPLVIINDLSFNYPSFSEVLSSISLTIHKGEMLSIVGHNGSGKSTLAKLIAGILEVAHGSIEIDGINIASREASSLRGKIGIVFQNPDNQFIGASVEDDIAFGLENKRVPRIDMESIIDDSLKRVAMLECKDREPVQLSGGQKQRVAIAGVLALNPDIIIMDEATSMLDPQGKKEISTILTEIRTQHPEKTIILITHDLEETILTDRVIVMNKGRIALDGAPEDVYQNEQFLFDIGLSVPFYYRVINDLKKNNLLRKSIHNIRELVEYLNENRI